MIFTKWKIQRHGNLWDIFLNVKGEFIFSYYYSLQVIKLKYVRQ